MNLKIKQHPKRFINSLGTAWKWIAEGPDHHDYIMIKKKINNILKNSNSQVVINRVHNGEINNITELVNSIVENIKLDKSFSNHSAQRIQYKLIKEEVVNVNYAAHWAKVGVINSLLLFKSEIEMLTKILDQENVSYSNVEEILYYANVKMITNGTILLYLINIPITKIDIYKNAIAEPVKQNDTIVKLNFNQLLVI